MDVAADVDDAVLGHVDLHHDAAVLRRPVVGLGPLKYPVDVLAVQVERVVRPLHHRRQRRQAPRGGVLLLALGGGAGAGIAVLVLGARVDAATRETVKARLDKLIRESVICAEPCDSNFANFANWITVVPSLLSWSQSSPIFGPPYLLGT